MKDVLLKSFPTKVSREEYRRQFDNKKITNRESYEDYYYGVLSLCYQLNPSMKDEEIVHYLIKGLPQRLAKEIYAKDPKTHGEVFEHLVSAAKFDSLLG